MKKREIVVGKKIERPPWRDQKSVLLRKYIRDMYSQQTLLRLEDRGGKVYLDGNLVTDLSKRVEPTSDVVIYLYRP